MVLAVRIIALLYVSLCFYIYQGQATDIQIQAEEILKMKKQLNGLYVKHTKQPLNVIGKRKMD